MVVPLLLESMHASPLYGKLMMNGRKEEVSTGRSEPSPFSQAIDGEEQEHTHMETSTGMYTPFSRLWLCLAFPVSKIHGPERGRYRHHRLMSYHTLSCENAHMLDFVPYCT